MVITNSNQRIGLSDKYEWLSASATVTGTEGTTDLSGITGFTTLFDSVGQASHIEIEVTANTYVRLNANDNDKILVTATTPFEADMTVHSIFVSTGGSASTITVKLLA